MHLYTKIANAFGQSDFVINTRRREREKVKERDHQFACRESESFREKKERNKDRIEIDFRFSSTHCHAVVSCSVLFSLKVLLASYTSFEEKVRSERIERKEMGKKQK